jgi:hypothetical protein
MFFSGVSLTTWLHAKGKLMEGKFEGKSMKKVVVERKLWILNMHVSLTIG